MTPLGASVARELRAAASIETAWIVDPAYLRATTRAPLKNASFRVVPMPQIETVRTSSPRRKLWRKRSKASVHPQGIGREVDRARNEASEAFATLADAVSGGEPTLKVRALGIV